MTITRFIIRNNNAFPDMIRFEEKEKFRFGWNVKINMQQSFCDSNGGYTLSSGLKAYVKEYLLEHYYALDYDEEGYDDYEEEFYS